MSATTRNPTRASKSLATADSAPELSLTADELKSAFRRHPAGVAVVTADDGSGPVGMTATSVFSVSAEPPLLVFSASNLSSSTPTILNAETVLVHLIDADTIDVAKLCATSGIDRFADTSQWRRLSTGEPLFTDVKVWIRGKVINRFDACGSTLIVVHAMESSISTDPDIAPAADAAAPLVYHSRQWHRLSDETLVQP